MSTVRPTSADGFPPNDRPVRVLLEQRGWLGRWGTRLPWILFILAVLFALSYRSSYQRYMQTNPKIQERYFSLSKTATQKVAIISVEGVIMQSDGFAKWQIDQVRDDPDVKAVVVRVDSPGGTVVGSDYIYHHLKQLREEKKIPIVISMGGVAASGGYYISMAAGPTPDSIFCERTGWTGSIGVIIPHYNAGQLLESWRIVDDSVTSGPLKAMGSPTRLLTPEKAQQEHDVLQGLVDQTFAQFKEIVSEARPKLAANANDFAKATTGQVFTAQQALELGLVDKLGFIEDAIDRAIQLANLNAADVQVVKYEQPAGLFNGLLLGESGDNSLASAAKTALNPGGGQLSVSALFDLATPRAYMLWSWIPAAIANGR
ncbi:MAG TPA: signal peptide peptidase SppA [Pirellulales bacterium]|jgi:protease-4